MKKLFIKLVIVFGLSCLNNSHAAYQTGAVKIDFLRTYKNYAVLSLDTDGDNQSNCTHHNARNHAYINLINDEGKAMYSAALTAFIVGRRVRVALNGCKSWGGTTIPLAYRIDIYKAQ